jgi:cytochrome P450
MARDPLGVMLQLTETHPDLARINLVVMPAYIVTSAEAAHEILVSKADKFWKGRLQKRMLSGRMFGNGLFLAEGEEWLRQRIMIQPSLHAKRLEGFAAAMVEEAQAMTASWQPGETRDLYEDIGKLTFRTLMRNLFGSGATDARTTWLIGALYRLQAAIAASAGSAMLPDWLPTANNRRINRTIAEVDGLLAEIVAERRAAGTDHGDILSMIIHAQDEKGGQMSQFQVRDEAMTMLVAAFETSSNTMAWTFALLAAHPDAEARLLAEIDAACGGGAPTYAAFRKMPYSKMFVEEALRAYPTAWLIVREAIEPVSVRGVDVPKGAGMILTPYNLHRNPKYFDDPTAFRPERFAPDAPPHPKGAYIPFGSGPRVCVGSAYAMMQAQLALTTVAQRFTLRMPPDQPLSAVQPQAASMLVPKGGLKMVVTPRA